MKWFENHSCVLESFRPHLLTHACFQVDIGIRKTEYAGQELNSNHMQSLHDRNSHLIDENKNELKITK